MNFMCLLLAAFALLLSCACVFGMDDNQRVVGHWQGLYSPSPVSKSALTISTGVLTGNAHVRPNPTRIISHMSTTNQP